MKAADQYINLFDTHLSLINKGASQAMCDVRDKAVGQFRQYGIPTIKDELFRHTDMEAIYSPDYGINLNRVEQSANTGLFRCGVPNLKTNTIYVVGDMPLQLSEEFENGVVVATFTDFADHYPQQFANCYNKLSEKSADGTVALNTALVQEGVVVYIPKGVAMQNPLQIVNVMNSSTSVMANRRLLIIAEPDSEATILICEHNLSEAQTLATNVTEVFAGENSKIDIYEIEETSSQTSKVSSMFVSQQANSNLLIAPIVLHNGVTRNNYHVGLVGKGANIDITGLAICDAKQKVDNYTCIRHSATHCESNQLIKYMVDDEAVASLLGSVIVDEGAEKTISQQVNKNISMSKQARVYTEPQLEIYADDVKCGHGSTVGQLDESALFYLRQRGIPEEEARMMLMLAFADDVLQRIKLEPLRDRLRSLIANRLRKGEAHCAGCSMCK